MNELIIFLAATIAIMMITAYLVHRVMKEMDNQ